MPELLRVARVERVRSDRERCARGDGKAEADRGTEARPEENRGADEREHNRRERDGQRPVPRRHELLEAQHRSERRRVVLPVRRDVAGEWDAQRQQEDPEGDEHRRTQRLAATRESEPEQHRCERHDREEVALLDPVRVEVRDEPGLEQQSDGEDERQHRERPFRPRARREQRDERARDEHDAGRVHQQHRVVRRPGQDAERMEADGGDPRVGAEHTTWAEREDGERRQAEEQEAQPVARRGAPHVPALEHEHGDGERERERDVLNARERRERREDEEGGLRAARRPVERDDSRVHAREHQRIRDRIGERERGVEQVGASDRNERGAERDRRRELQPAREQVDGHRGE